MSRGAAKEPCAFERGAFFRSAADSYARLGIPGLAPLGYIFSPLRGSLAKRAGSALTQAERLGEFSRRGILRVRA
jgi:hypothetical protein